MHQTSFLPSIFDLIPRADTFVPSQDKENPTSAAFDGILSEMVSNSDTAEQTIARGENATPDEPQRTSEREQASTERDSQAVADDVREDSEADNDTAERDAENTNDETDHGVPEKEKAAEEETPGDGEDRGTTEGEREPVEEAETSESTDLPSRNTEFVADSEITVMAMVEKPEISPVEGEQEPLQGAETSEPADLPSKSAELVRDSEITVMAMVEKPEISAVATGKTLDNAAQVIRDGAQQTPQEPTNDYKAPREQVAVEKDITPIGHTATPKEDVLPDMSPADVVKKAVDAHVVKSETKQTVEPRPVPESTTQDAVKARPAEVEVKETTNSAEQWTPNNLVYVSRTKVEEIVTMEVRSNEASSVDVSTQTDQTKEAVLPLTKNVEVNVSLDTNAQTHTDPNTTKSLDSKESFEIVEGDAPDKNAEKTGRLAQSGGSRTAAGRSLELERSVGTQIVRGTLTTLRSGRNELLLQLRPPDLGSVQIKLTLESNVMTARIIVSTEDVREMVQRQIEYLRNSLADEGVKIERFDVQVGQQYDKQATGNTSTEDQRNFPGEGPLTGDDAQRYDSKADAVRNIDKVKSENTRIHIIA